LKKVHGILVEEKRPVRFGTWDAKEVSLTVICNTVTVPEIKI